MKKTCDFLRVNKKIFPAIAILLIVFLCVGVAFAAITYISAKGKIDMTTITLNAQSEFSYTENTENLTFTKPGEKKTIQVTTTNSTDSVLSCSYGFKIAATDSKLPQAILVYFNDEYIGTLQELTDANVPAITGAYVDAGSGATATDSITLELHLGAENSLYNKQSVTLTTTAYTSTADYVENIFVSTSAEMNKAIDDINSGLLPETTQIVLTSDVAFSNVNTIQQPCTVLLNGHTLSGAATLDGKTAYLNVIGNGTNSATCNLTQYYETKVNELLLAAAQTALQDGVNSEATVGLFGHLKFYNPTVTVSGKATYADGILTASTVDRSEVETLTVNGEKLEFTILDKATSIVGTYLKNVPNSDTAIVTGDLYLPTSIRSEGASIEWTSSNEGVMDNTGKITAAKADKEPVKLYATIRVNGTVKTEVFSFNVSAHTNEINFYKLVSAMSPVIIYEIANLEATPKTGLYQLPVVDSTKDYDYRKTYDTPTPGNSAQTPDEAGKILNYHWEKYPEIFLTDLSYSLLKTTTTGEGGTETETEIYPYIALDETTGTQLYLKQNTLNTYAEIKVTGTFETGETYESRVRIIIATGTDTSILDEAFNHAQEKLQEVNVLKNILETRVTSGMANEKGDFTLPASYTAANGNKYGITYVDSTKNGLINVKETEGEDTYTVEIDPTHFSDIESRAAITVTVSFGTGDNKIERSRTLYFTVPAAVHTADLGNATLFNTVKYQVFMQLPDDEKTGNTGFVVGDTITNTTPDYILLRDILGDATYKTEYYTLSGDYLYNNTVNHAGCRELWFYTAGNDSTYTDTAARDLAALINWATGKNNTTETAGSVVTNTAALGSYASTLSNGKEYLDDNEVNVIKTYYQAVTGNHDDTYWNALWNQVAERAPGYIITNGAALNEVVKDFASVNDSNNGTQIYFQYNEVLQWATNVRDNDYDGVDGMTFAPGNFTCDMISTTDSKAPETSITVNETRNGVSGNVTYAWFYTANGRKWYYHAASYNGSRLNKLKYSLSKGSYIINSVDGNYTLDDQSYGSYLEDDTSYISPAEAQVIIAYWVSREGGENAKEYIDALYANMVRPTYFTAEGAQILLDSLYTDANIAVGKEGGFKTAAVSATVDAQLDTTGSKLAGKTVPAIINLEDISTGIRYFSGLTGLYIKGTESLPAFLSDYGVSAAVSRIAQVLPDLTTLVMEHAADNYVSFDLTNIKNIKNLTQVDVSDNEGITNVNRLVNYNSDKYTYVDFSHVNVSMEFQQYTLDNVGKADDRSVWYSESIKGDRISYNKPKLTDNALTYLDGLDTIIAENMFVATEVTHVNAEGTDTTDKIYWRIESGNQITLVEYAGIVEEFSDLGNYYNYYYCNATFEYNGGTFTAGRVYRLSYENGNVILTDVGLDVQKEVTSIPTEVEFTQAEIAAGESLSGTETTTKTEETTGGSGTFISNTGWNNTTSIRFVTGTTTTLGSSVSVYTLGYDSTTATITTTTTRNYTGGTRASKTVYYYIDGKVVECIYHYYSDVSYTETVSTQTVTTYNDIYYTTSRNGDRTYIKDTEYESATGYRTGTYYYNYEYTYFTTEPVNNESNSETSNATKQEYDRRTYYSPVGKIGNDQNIETIKESVTKIVNNPDTYYRYTGNRQTIEYYADGIRQRSITYTNGTNYEITVGTEGFLIEESTLSLPPAGETSMDLILRDANDAFNSAQYGMYYGMYYAYSGTDFYSLAAPDGVFKQNGIYRIVLNDTKTGFVFELSGSFTELSAEDITNYIRDNVWGDGTTLDRHVGEIFRIPTSGGGMPDNYIKKGDFFTLAYNADSGSYALKAVRDVDISVSTDIIKFINCRSFAVMQYDYGYTTNDHTGTGGTYTVIISAFVRVDGVEYVRRYSVDVVG